MMRSTLVFCVLAVVQASFLDSLTGSSNSYESAPKVSICHKDLDLFKVEANALKVSPYPPKKSKEITVTLDGTMTKELQQIKMSIDIHYGIVPLGKHDVSLCSEVHCPIPAGPFHVDRTFTLPSSAPAGTYTFSVKGTNENNEEIICASIKMAVDN